MKNSETEVSMLKARYMRVLASTVAMAKISALVEPMLDGMLNSAAK